MRPRAGPYVDVDLWRSWYQNNLAPGVNGSKQSCELQQHHKLHLLDRHIVCVALLDGQEKVIAPPANRGANLTHVSEPTVLRVMEPASEAECDTWQLGGRDFGGGKP